MLNIGAVKAWIKELIGPEYYGLLGDAYSIVVAPVFSEPRLQLLLLLTTLAAAVTYALLSVRVRGIRGMLAYLFPRSVFLHPSAVLDYKFYVINQWVMGHLRLGRWIVGLVGLLALTQTVSGLLTSVLGPTAVTTPTPLVIAMFTLATLLATDFGKYVAHYVAHKVPVLWEFHKVHHAAEVLTPMSSFRSHPIDIMLDYFFRLLCVGVLGGVYTYLYPSGIAVLEVFGFNAIAFFIHYWIGHLLHSHIPIGYGPLSRVLISPVMHQVHHSREERHWDKNFGFCFSLWDVMFRTAYVPTKGESFRLGLPDTDGKNAYSTLRALYLLPFAAAWRRLTRSRSAADAGRTV